MIFVSEKFLFLRTNYLCGPLVFVGTWTVGKHPHTNSGKLCHLGITKLYLH